MRKVIAVLFVAFILVLLSLPVRADAVDDLVILVVRNESLSSAQVFITLQNGNVVKTYRVPGQEFSRQDLPRELFRQQNFKFFVRMSPVGGAFESDELPSTVNGCELVLAEPLEYSRSRCFNGFLKWPIV